VLISNDFDTTKNQKLVPNWKGPTEIIDINDTNAKVKLKNKIKVLNVAKFFHFFENIAKSEDGEDDADRLLNQNSDKALKDFSDVFNQAHIKGPITRAQVKLIKYKDAAQLALILLKSETENMTLYATQVTIALSVKVKRHTLATKTHFNSSGANYN